MNVVIDIEANGLHNPSKIWVIVCKDIDTGQLHIFRKPSDDPQVQRDFLAFSDNVSYYVGHNILGYDLPVLDKLLGSNLTQDASNCLDTYVLSKLVDYPRSGHSVEDYGSEFNLPKLDCKDFSKYTPEMEEYCIRDVEVTHKIYLKYLKVIKDPSWAKSIDVEQKFQLLVNDMNNNGFAFRIDKAKALLVKIEERLGEFDEAILEAFPPREVVVREFTPKATKFGTISKSSVPRSLVGNIAEYEVGKTYKQTKLVEFNPASHKQIIDVLNAAGWKPEDKTATHIEAEREFNQLRYRRNKTPADVARFITLTDTAPNRQKYGWKINETNLATLPADAPSPARTLAQRILYESRRRTLTEWLSLARADTGRIHPQIFGIGAWTHRTASQKPNVQNIPTDRKLFGKEMRSLWWAGKNRLLVGVDADSIQFRVAAHYIGDPELIQKIITGKKSDGTDPHSHNKKVIGAFCKTRDASKRTLFSLILGGSPRKFAEIMESTVEQGEEARDNLYKEYPGLVTLKNEIVVEDARRGWFPGFDGRKVRIPGDTFSERKHLCPSGYLQNGEAVVMKVAAIRWNDVLTKEFKDVKKYVDWMFVDMIHDEYQTECQNNMELAMRIAKAQADALKWAGEELGLKCPMAGSFFNDDTKDYTIGINWYETH